jgi:hypothetical protein
MTAEEIGKGLGGRKCGHSWIACCPAHVDRMPSLSITETHEGKILVHCHAGCDQENVIAALQARGLWTAHSERSRHALHEADPKRASALDNAATKRRDAALAIWRAARPAEGTPVEIYLRSRGLAIPVPAPIRFHAGLKHPSGNIWPAMLALVTNGVSGEPTGIHRTFLTRGGDSKAPVDPAKMMLGPCSGGVVRLGQPDDGMVMVGEGIETCLAAMQASSKPAWAALSTSGLRSLDLPRDIHDVLVLADGDDPGEAAANDCARRLKREGRRVRIARPPRGLDFNDLLLRFAPRVEGGDG